ncbi:hypothetical protein K493DRAFT_411702 [Basidiobolus meristosporus CBS 931.73]|uniref:Senescence domain-containing protein n=1 Tax=Basidiobolus meristosporus CBS 931.73 TaxID=1314790 RepID=A0A1Y1XBQ5_9FUNG|nr:hypothetical protein K493DRAFT_411702 [Basidiobolus meristosporus CBS 931.73]|eukprot:ORX83155.1 hypothetical protein K493DRAFT_411702 [Basidiobolus meristosporus CBS 931.73]
MTLDGVLCPTHQGKAEYTTVLFVLPGCKCFFTNDNNDTSLAASGELRLFLISVPNTEPESPPLYHVCFLTVDEKFTRPLLRNSKARRDENGSFIFPVPHNSFYRIDIPEEAAEEDILRFQEILANYMVYEYHDYRKTLAIVDSKGEVLGTFSENSDLKEDEELHNMSEKTPVVIEIPEDDSNPTSPTSPTSSTPLPNIILPDEDISAGASGELAAKDDASLPKSIKNNMERVYLPPLETAGSRPHHGASEVDLSEYANASTQTEQHYKPTTSRQIQRVRPLQGAGDLLILITELLQEWFSRATLFFSKKGRNSQSDAGKKAKVIETFQFMPTKPKSAHLQNKASKTVEVPCRVIDQLWDSAVQVGYQVVAENPQNSNLSCNPAEFESKIRQATIRLNQVPDDLLQPVASGAHLSVQSCNHASCSGSVSKQVNPYNSESKELKESELNLVYIDQKGIAHPALVSDALTTKEIVKTASNRLKVGLKRRPTAKEVFVPSQ